MIAGMLLLIFLLLNKQDKPLQLSLSPFSLGNKVAIFWQFLDPLLRQYLSPSYVTYSPVYARLPVLCPSTIHQRKRLVPILFSEQEQLPS